MPDCKACENQKWKEMYITAQQRFDQVTFRLTIGFVIMFIVLLLCLFSSILFGLKTQHFINDFEYVEETEIQIEQDCNGKNTVILPNGDEVRTDGSEIYREEKEILEKESNNKINTITVCK